MTMYELGAQAGQSNFTQNGDKIIGRVIGGCVRVKASLCALVPRPVAVNPVVVGMVPFHLCYGRVIIPDD